MRKLLVSFIVLFTLIFSYTILAQEIGSIRRNDRKHIPVKLMKPNGPPLAAGTYTIGSGGDFPTIDSAFNKLSVDGIAGEVTLELIDTLYIAPTTEYGFLLNGPIPGANENNRVQIIPNPANGVTIEGDGGAVLSFINTSYLTLGQYPGIRLLEIHALHNAQFTRNDCVLFLDNSDHNIISKVDFISEDYTRDCCGIIFWVSNSSIPFAPDSNTIQYNYMSRAGIGIYLEGYSTAAKGNVIRENYIGWETDGFITRGIHLFHNQNAIIENNIVQEIGHHSNSSFFNDIILGINAYWSDGTIIRNNMVHNIDNNSGYYGAAGILLSGSTGEFGNNNLVYNNIVYDIRNSSSQSTSCAAGINIWNQNNPKIYYNSVYLSNTGSSPSRSAAFNVVEQCSNIEAKNNIFVNTRDESPYCASAIYDYTAANLTSDNNDVFYDDTNTINCLVRIGSTKFNTLADWQTTGKDLHSISEMPNFMAADDLHLDSGYLTNTESRATPITGIDTDFDGDARDSQHPDIGADEFDGQVKIFSQESWTKHGNPILLFGSAGEWDDEGAIMPCVIFDGNTYKMWFSGYDGSNWRIGYATSLDGINWTKYNDPATVNPPYAESDPVVNLGPGAWENVWVYAPFVFFDGTIYHMWYAGTDGNTDRVGYATSPDGIIWTKNPTNPVINLGPSGTWDDTYVDPGPVIFDGTTFHMLYNGSDGLHYQGGYATSIDGINWTKSPDPVISFGPVGSWDNPRVQPNSLVYNDSTSKYFLFYSGGAFLDWRIGYATASSLSGPWAKDPSIMLDVTPGGFESDVVGFPYVIEDPVSNLYKMWYMGGASGSFGAIGYATTPNWPLAVEDEIKIPENYFLEQNFPNPFNPMTKIQYSIPQSSNVTIKIFDILGSEIEILVNEEKPIGTYEVNWNAVNLSSGVYFYQLSATGGAGSFIETKKMLLLK